MISSTVPKTGSSRRSLEPGRSAEPGKISEPGKIADRIRVELLESGVLKSGDQLPSIRELGERYGFARASLVHALALLERDGLIRRRQGVGCFVTDGMETAPRTTSDLVGFVSNSERHRSRILVNLCLGIEETTRAFNSHFIFASAQSIRAEQNEVDRLVAAGCRSIIVYPVIRTMTEMRTDYLKYKHRNISIVLVDMAYPEQIRTQVVFDNYRAGFDITKALIDHGHQRIVFMRETVAGDQLMHYSNNQRHRGYRDAMSLSGLTPVSWNEDHGHTAETLREFYIVKMTEARLRGQGPTAVIVKQDPYVGFFTPITREMGLRVPEDVVFAGFDNEDLPLDTAPPMLTTNPDFRGMGQLAARLAMRPEEVQGTRYVLPVPILDRGLGQRESAPGAESLARAAEGDTI